MSLMTLSMCTRALASEWTGITRSFGMQIQKANVRIDKGRLETAKTVAPAWMSGGARGSGLASPSHRRFSSALRDREYWVPQRRPARRGFGFDLQPGRGWGSGMSGDTALYSLLGANVAVFALWQYAASNPSLRRFMAGNFVTSEQIVKSGRVHTLFTSAFSHVELFHLGSNCLALYFFGRGAASHLGGSGLIRLYVVGGVVGSVSHILYHMLFTSARPRQVGPFIYQGYNYSPKVLGASAAINAIVALEILRNPMQIIMVNLFVPMPACVLGGLFLARDMFYAFNTDTRSRESHAAHLGGAAVGTIAFLLLRRGGGIRMY